MVALGNKYGTQRLTIDTEATWEPLLSAVGTDRRVLLETLDAGTTVAAAGLEFLVYHEDATAPTSESGHLIIGRNVPATASMMKTEWDGILPRNCIMYVRSLTGGGTPDVLVTIMPPPAIVR